MKKFAIIVLLSAVWIPGSPNALAQIAHSLVRDLNTTVTGSPGSLRDYDLTANPMALAAMGNAVKIGNVIYFAAEEPVNGLELWKTDGTAGGTVLVKDIRPGPPGSAITLMTRVGAALYFMADNGLCGLELWRSDGTAAGTALVGDLSPGPPSTPVTWSLGSMRLADGGGMCFFNFDDAVHGEELWMSDGTQAGTALFKDINPGAAKSAPKNFAYYQDYLYFSADDGTHGTELWRTDGTEAGTTLVKEFVSGSSGGSPGYLTVSGPWLYLAASVVGRSVWRSDGTAPGTVELQDATLHESFQMPLFMTDLGGTLYFFAKDYGVPNFQDKSILTLCRTDGTDAGSIRIKPGFLLDGLSIYEHYLNFCSFNGQVYFGGDTIRLQYEHANGVELWKTDGTQAGTVMLKDLAPGADNWAKMRSSFPGFLTVAAGKLLFSASDETTSRLWLSDGTADGTVPIAGPRVPKKLLELNGGLFFMADDPVSGPEPWRSDGTPAGTAILKDIWAPGHGYPTNLQRVGGMVYFAADDGAHGPEPWTSDGTANGTRLIKDLNPGPLGSDPKLFTYCAGSLYFVYHNGSKYVVAKSDGTAAGMSDLLTATYPTSEMISAFGKVFFNFSDSNNDRELWQSDGTLTGTKILKDIQPGNASSSPGSLTVLNDKIYFTAYTSAGRELWRSDGTAAGTVLVKDIYPGNAQTDAYYNTTGPIGLTAVGGTLFFSADDKVNGRELWQSAGAGGGTTMVKDILPGAAGSKPSQLSACGGVLFFTATDGATGYELWRSDGTSQGTHLVRDIRPGPAGSTPGNFRVLDGTLFFTANDGTAGWELWKSDGTTAGTTRVRDINIGPAGSLPSNLTAFNGILFFSADDGTNGNELWMSDGKNWGTRRAADVTLGALGANPAELTPVGGLLFFSAADQNVSQGRELWVFDLDRLRASVIGWTRY